MSSPSANVQVDPILGLQPTRLAVATTLLVGACAGSCFVALQSPSTALHVTAGVLVALLAGSTLEWYVHVFLCHYDRGFQRGIYHQHHRSHHRLGAAPMTKPLWMRLGEQFVGQFFAATLVIALPVHLLVSSVTLTAALLVTLLCVSFAIAFLHHCYHGEIRGSFEKTKWFRHLRGQHLRHHQDLSINLNVVVPIADLCIGTHSAQEPGSAKPRYTERSSGA